MKLKYLLFLLVLCCVGCNQENDASDIVFKINPDLQQSASSGSYLLFNIQAWTIHESLQNFEVSSFDKENGLLKLSSITLDTKQYSDIYTYRVPEIKNDTLDISLYFSFSDSRNNSTQREVKVLAYPSSQGLSEHSNITLFSPFSGKRDAFSLSFCQTLISSEASDSTLMDVYMYADNSDTFSVQWRSYTGTMFVRAGELDYSAITTSQLNIVYDASVKSESVKNIAYNDIIVVGDSLSARGVFKIMQVYDIEGVQDDRVIFGYKSIR